MNIEEAWNTVGRSVRSDAPVIQAAVRAAMLVAHVDACVATSPHCHAGRDGDCIDEGCPQLRDGEPKRSGRSCPLENWGDEEDEITNACGDGWYCEKAKSIEELGKEGEYMKIISFGFNHLDKHPDSNNTVLFDCRDLPLPRARGSGLDRETRDDVLQHPEAEELIVQGVGVALGASRDVAFGCMSGFQRSVVIAEEVASRVRDMGIEIELEHRSLDPIFQEKPAS